MEKQQKLCKNCGHTLSLVEITRRYYILGSDDKVGLTQEKEMSTLINLELFCTYCGETYQCDIANSGIKIKIGKRKSKGAKID